MNSTRKQRRAFVLNAKKQWKNGEISKDEYLELKRQIADMGREQHEELRRSILESQGVKIVGEEDIDIDAELVDEEDFTPEDL